MRRVGGIVASCIVAFGLVEACASPPFMCGGDDDCAGLEGGACEVDGYCSVPDSDCPSQRRYAAHSGPKSNQCVDEDVADGGTTAASDTDGSESSGGGSTTPAMTSTPGTSSVDDTSGSTGEPEPAELVLHLPFDDEIAMGSGAVDVGPFGLDATCQDFSLCPTYTDGVSGGAAAFDGTQYLEIVDAGPLDLTNGLTIALWVRDLAPDPMATRVIYSRLIGDGFAASYELEFFDLTITGAVADADAQVLAQAPYVQDPTAPWMHLALVVDGAELLVYRDAELIASTDGAALGYEESPLFIGADQDAGGGINDYFIGELDELQIFARPLAQDELEALIDATTG
jgi:hypothetical protein